MRPPSQRLPQRLPSPQKPAERRRPRRPERNPLLAEAPRQQGGGLAVAAVMGVLIAGLTVAWIVLPDPGIWNGPTYARGDRTEGLTLLNLEPNQKPPAPVIMGTSGEVPIYMVPPESRPAPQKPPDPGKVGLDDPLNAHARMPSGRPTPFVAGEQEPGIATELEGGNGLPDSHKRLTRSIRKGEDDLRGGDATAADADSLVGHADLPGTTTTQQIAFMRYVQWLGYAESERERAREVQHASGRARSSPELVRARLERLRDKVERTKPPVPPDCLMLDTYYRRALEGEAQLAERAVAALAADDVKGLEQVRRRRLPNADTPLQRANMELMRLCRAHDLRARLRLAPTSQGVLGAVLQSGSPSARALVTPTGANGKSPAPKPNPSGPPAVLRDAGASSDVPAPAAGRNEAGS